MTTDTLSRAFAALADPTRRAILERLANSDATGGELAAPFAMSQQAPAPPYCWASLCSAFVMPDGA